MKLGEGNENIQTVSVMCLEITIRLQFPTITSNFKKSVPLHLPVIITCGRTSTTSGEPSYTHSQTLTDTHLPDTSPLELLTNKHLFSSIHRGEDPLVFGMKIIKQGKHSTHTLTDLAHSGSGSAT